MARSRRKTTGTTKGKSAGTKAAAKPAATDSAAFATAHDFVDTPASASPRRAPRAKAPASAAAASAAGTPRAEEAAAARPDSTEQASVAASQEAAEAADRAVAGQEEPLPGAAAAVAGASADPASDPALADAAAADERAGVAPDPYADSAGDPDPAPAHGAAGYGAADPADALHPEHEGERPGAAAVALAALVGIIAVAALTLWLAPKAAPHLPGGVARYLVPGQVAVEDRIAGLESRLADSEAAADRLVAAQPDLQTLETRIEELQAQLTAMREEQAGAGTDADARAGLETAAAERDALAGRIDEVGQAMSGLRSEIDAMNQALAEGQGGDGPTNPELATALAQLQSRVDSLSGEVEGARSTLSDQVAALSQRLDAALSRADEAETARAEAEAEAGRAAAAAALNEALARLETRFQRGEPYDAALDEVASLTGSAPPEALAGAATAGVATPSALADGLSRVAREAIAAAPRSDAADGPFAGAVAWFRAQVAGRPSVETAGGGVGAVLSRVEARLEEGEPAAALAEAEALPEASRAAIAPWLDELAARAAAGRALEEWRAGLAAAG